MPRVNLSISHELYNEIEAQAINNNTTVNLLIINILEGLYYTDTHFDYNEALSQLIEEAKNRPIGMSFILSDLPSFAEISVAKAESANVKPSTIRARLGKAFNAAIANGIISNIDREKTLDKNGNVTLKFISRAAAYIRKIEKNDLYERITEHQLWKGNEISFDPDSSPIAWEYYKIAYSSEFWKCRFDISNPKVYTYQEKEVDIDGIKYRYSDMPMDRLNRLVATKIDLSNQNSNKKMVNGRAVLYYLPCLRLAGETDFSFKKSKIWRKFDRKYESNYTRLESALIGANDISCEERDRALKLLEENSKKHHALINFSLMQVMGGLNNFKGRDPDGLDRLDRFIYYLDRYFKEKNKEETEICKHASKYNRGDLIDFLSNFDDVNHYTSEVYFVGTRDTLTEEITRQLIELGEDRLKTGKQYIKYLELANVFWNKKEECFLKRLAVYEASK